jgi:hypothetical protein
MKIEAVFMNQWHQPIKTKKPLIVCEIEDGAMIRVLSVPVPVGAIHMRLERVDDDQG